MNYENMLVLIVDDMSTMRKLVMRACREIGFRHFLEAADGAAGWEVLNGSKEPIELVISDWNMPQSTGIDLLKRVRSDKRFMHTPFLLVTAESEQHLIMEAINAGVSGYVVKPFTPDALKKQLDSAVKKNAA